MLSNSSAQGCNLPKQSAHHSDRDFFPPAQSSNLVCQPPLVPLWVSGRRRIVTLQSQLSVSTSECWSSAGHLLVSCFISRLISSCFVLIPSPVYVRDLLAFECGSQALITLQTAGASRTVMTMSTVVSQPKRAKTPHLG